MKVGVLGSGQVALVLARGFRSRGHEVMIGSRSVAKVQESAAGMGASAGTFRETAAFGELLVLAVKGTAAENALELAGAEEVGNKVVIDTTNPIADEPPVDGVLRFFTGPNESLLERLQTARPKARFVKAWSSVGSALMVDPVLPGGPPTMFICGDDAQARDSVATILRRFGWEVEDLGAAAAARAIEPLCILWCIPGFKRNDWAHAFKMLR